MGRLVFGEKELIGEVEQDEQNTLFITYHGNTIVPVTPIHYHKPVVRASNSPTYSSDYIYELQKYDWNWQTAYAIMMCESSGNPNAVGDKRTKYWSYGLMQIRALPGRPNPSWLLVPENNISYAYSLWSTSGWSPWLNCSRKIS